MAAVMPDPIRHPAIYLPEKQLDSGSSPEWQKGRMPGF